MVGLQFVNIRNQTVSDGVAHSNFIIPCYHISDNPSIWLWPGAILVLQQNCAYLVTFDLDLENIVDADRPGDHFVQVWWGSVHLPMSRSNLSATTKLPIFCDLWPWAKCGCGPTWEPRCASWWACIHLPRKRSNLSATPKFPISRDLWPLPRAHP